MTDPVTVEAGDPPKRSPAPVRRASRRQGRGLVDGWVLAVAAVAVVATLVGVGTVLARAGTGQGRQVASDRGATTVREGSGVPPQPTTVFAHMKRYGVDLHFPASPADMVAVGYHQAWNTKATDMVPALRVYPKESYAHTKGALSADPTLRLFLMMSRGRGSSAYSAADCAVRPDAVLLSPVTGIVTLVKTYKLAGYGTDYRVEIKADGAAPVRVVMIHIRDVRVKPGMRVSGGVTPVAKVRHLTIDSQVNRYLPVQADHTHVQINAAGYVLNGGS